MGIEDILDTALSADAPISGQRREHDRTEFRVAVRVHEILWERDGTASGVCDEGSAATTVDISRAGIGLVSYRPCEPGTAVLIVIQRRGRGALVLSGVVEYSSALTHTPTGPGRQYHIGVAFQAAPKYPAVDAWVSTHAASIRPQS